MRTDERSGHVPATRLGVASLTSHWLCWLGLALGITAICTWLFMAPAPSLGRVGNQCRGVVLYLVLPFALLVGFGLVTAGIVVGRRRLRDHLEAALGDRRAARQRLIVFLALIVGANLVAGTLLTYRAVHYLETTRLCAPPAR